MAKPEHVDELESGGMVCRHCGGAVDADGYSSGGEVDDPEATALLDDNNDESKETAQLRSTQRTRSLADALEGRGRR